MRDRHDNPWTLNNIIELNRDEEWESLLRIFLGYFTSEHPVLNNSPMLYSTVDDRLEQIEYFINHQNPNLMFTSFWVTLRMTANENDSFTNYEFLEEFIYLVNNLIENIPYLEDYELYFNMRKIFSLLNDIHSGYSFRPDPHPFFTERFPLDFAYFADGVFVVGAPLKYEWLLGNRLEKINGIPILEVIDVLSAIIMYESRYEMPRSAMRMLAWPEALRFFGVVDSDNIVKYYLLDENGEEVIVSIQNIPISEFEEIETVRLDIGVGMLYNKHQQAPFFFENLYENNMLYVRARSFHYVRFSELSDPMDLNNEFRETINAMVTSVIECGEKQIFVLDLRGNGGGAFLPAVPELGIFLRENNDLFHGIYVITDRGTASAAVMTAAYLRTRVDGVYIIGEPAAQSPNFFYGISLPATSHRRGFVYAPNMRFAASQTFAMFWPDYPYETLMPDIRIPIYIRDLLVGHDAVLEYIKARHHE